MPYEDLVPEDNTPKPVTRSKTVWINVASAVAAVVIALANTDLIQENPQMAGLAAAAVSVANIVLRVITSKPVKLLT